MNFKGTTSLVLSRQAEQSYNEATGWGTTVTYKGLYADIEAAAASSVYTNGASRVNVRQEPGGYGVLEIVYPVRDTATIDQPADEPETDVWTLAPYEVQRNTWEHPRYRSLDLQVDPGHKMKVVESVDAFRNKVRAEMEARSVNPDSGDPPASNPFNMSAYMLFKYGQALSYVDDQGNTQIYNYTQENEDLSEELARLLLAGHETYNEDKYTLRNTQIVQANTSLNVSTFKTGFQWSVNKISDRIRDESNTFTFSKYALISELLTDFSNTFWLKRAPTISEMHNGKFEISSEWVLMTGDATGPTELPVELFPIYA